MGPARKLRTSPTSTAMQAIVHGITGASKPGRHYGLHRADIWGRVPWWTFEALQRDLVQTRLADRLLGTLVDELRKNGLYDETLLVVAVTTA